MDILDYLPQKLHEEPLYSEIADVLQQVVSQSELNITDIRNKYRDYLNLRDEVVEEVIKEFGYEYITDILRLTTAEIQLLIGYVSLIHFLKGHRVGAELVLKLLGISGTFIEWWEFIGNIDNIQGIFGITNDSRFLTNSSIYTPTWEPYTYYLRVLVNQSRIKSDTIDKLKIFLRQYVYPVLIRLDYIAYYLETYDHNNIIDTYTHRIEDWWRVDARDPLFDDTLFTNNHVSAPFKTFRTTYLSPFLTNCGYKWESVVDYILPEYDEIVDYNAFDQDYGCYTNDNDFTTNTQVGQVNEIEYTYTIPAWTEYYHNGSEVVSIEHPEENIVRTISEPVNQTSRTNVWSVGRFYNIVNHPETDYYTNVYVTAITHCSKTANPVIYKWITETWLDILGETREEDATSLRLSLVGTNRYAPMYLTNNDVVSGYAYTAWLHEEVTPYMHRAELTSAYLDTFDKNSILEGEELNLTDTGNYENYKFISDKTILFTNDKVNRDFSRTYSYPTSSSFITNDNDICIFKIKEKEIYIKDLITHYLLRFLATTNQTNNTSYQTNTSLYTNTYFTETYTEMEEIIY